MAKGMGVISAWMARYNGAYVFRLWRPAGFGAEQVADITEYRGKNFIASLINDTCPGKLIYYNISGKVF